MNLKLTIAGFEIKKNIVGTRYAARIEENSLEGTEEHWAMLYNEEGNYQAGETSS